MCDKELFTCSTRSKAHRPSEDGPGTEMCIESSGAGGRLQCTDVDLEFPRQHSQRQQFLLPLVLSHGGTCVAKDVKGHGTTCAIPSAQRLFGYRK